ncbi:MAG: acyl carrier protein [Acidobacteriaceae bacterium]
MADVSMDEIRKIVGIQLGIRAVNEYDRLIEDLGAESADVANLVALVEEKYAVKIHESELARIYTPHDLYELIRSRMK